jgi:hypothetical protein
MAANLALMAFSSEGSFLCHTYCDMGPLFIRSHPQNGTHVPQWDSNQGCKDHQILAPPLLPLHHAGDFVWVSILLSHSLIDWLIICCFTSRSRIFHLYGDVIITGRDAKFRPMLSAHGLWAGRDLYHATPAVTRDLGFSGFIRRTAPFSCLLRYTMECGGPILTRIRMGLSLINKIDISNMTYILQFFFFL